jgi:phospholipid/cholesterol/gamma-HCH transport system permease protein
MKIVIQKIESKLSQSVLPFGKGFLNFAEYVGGVAHLSFRTLYHIFTFRISLEDLVKQFLQIGNKSLSIVFLIAIFTGMVMALQMAIGLRRFGLALYIGQVVGLAIFRELAPVLTSIMIAARCGSGIAAELGSMVVTEQVLAIEAMGANPIRKLVVPRVLATVLATPLLTIMANVVGIFGAMLIAMMETGVTARFFMDQVKKTVQFDDFMSGVFKTVFFGFLIAVIACHQGLSTRGGTAGVGFSTTRAVVYCAITIFISDFFLTKLFLMF